MSLQKFEALDILDSPSVTALLGSCGVDFEKWPQSPPPDSIVTEDGPSVEVGLIRTHWGFLIGSTYKEAYTVKRIEVFAAPAIGSPDFEAYRSAFSIFVAKHLDPFPLVELDAGGAYALCHFDIMYKTGEGATENRQLTDFMASLFQNGDIEKISEIACSDVLKNGGAELLVQNALPGLH